MDFATLFWIRLRLTSFLAAQNLALRQQLAVLKRNKQTTEDQNNGQAFLGFAFHGLEPLAQISHYCQTTNRYKMAP